MSTPQTLPTEVNRHPERARTDRESLYAVLDSTIIATLSTVVDGKPWVVPMLFARVGDMLVVHGSTGAGALRYVASGAPAALSVAMIDGIVVAHTGFESSANYRSAVVNGVLEPLKGDEKWDALNALTSRVIPGRAGEIRDMTKKEMAATTALAIRITDGHWTVKIRDAFSSEPEEETDAWMGIVPVRTVYDPPITAPHSTPGAPVPESVLALGEGTWADQYRA